MALTIYNPVADYRFFGEGWGWGSTNDEFVSTRIKELPKNELHNTNSASLVLWHVWLEFKGRERRKLEAQSAIVGKR